MKIHKRILLLLICSLFVQIGSVTAQLIRHEAIPRMVLGNVSVEQLSNSIFELSSPAFEGREIGTEGNEKTSDWLRYTFMQMQVRAVPGFDNLFQEYPIHRLIAERVSLNMGDDELVFSEDFSIAYFSAEGEGSGMLSLSGRQAAGDFLLLELKNEQNAYSEALKYQQRGFKGVVFYTLDDELHPLGKYRYEEVIDLPTRAEKRMENTSQPYVRARQLNIPVFFITHERILDWRSKNIAQISISYSIELEKSDDRNARNIIGYTGPEWGANRRVPFILVTTYFDHQGLHPESGLPFFGSVDNASGVAAMLESIRVLQLASNRLIYPIVWVVLNGNARDKSGQTLLEESGMLNMNDCMIHISVHSIAATPRGEDPNIYLNLNMLSNDLMQAIGLLADKHELNYVESVKSFDFFTEIPRLDITSDDFPYRNRVLDSPDKVNLAQLFQTTQFLAELVWNLSTIRDREAIHRK